MSREGKRERDESGSSSSSDSSESSDRDRHKHHRREEKRHKHSKHGKKHSSKEKSHSRDKHRSSKEKRHKHSKKKHGKDKKSSRDKNQRGDDGRGNLMGSWGKYGVIRDDRPDGSRYESEFNAWMSEVQGVGAAALARWEVEEHWKTFCEDFNTGTLPHEKYYDLRKWMLKNQSGERPATERVDFDDEEALRRERAEAARRKDQAVTRETLIRMGATNAIENMREQELAKMQMQHAWRTGDTKKAEEMLKRFEPETEKEKWQRLKAEARSLG